MCVSDFSLQIYFSKLIIIIILLYTVVAREKFRDLFCRKKE